MSREALEAEWLHLTRVELPALASSRDWPVIDDHCFQRILLDNACECCWYDAIPRRPAYRHASDVTLAAALALGCAVVDGSTDLRALHDRSIRWRRTRRARRPGSGASTQRA